MNFNVRQKKVINAEESKILCLATAACGKALPNSVLLPTPNGQKYVQDVKKGDYLFDRFGKPTKVLDIFPQGMMDVYEIIFEDGRKTRCSLDHIWRVRKTNWFNKKKYVDMTLDEIIKLREKTHKVELAVPLSKEVHYEVKEQLKIDPYIIGVSLSNHPMKEEYYEFVDITGNKKHIAKFIGELINANPVRTLFGWDFEDRITGLKCKTEDVFKGRLDLNKIPDCYKYSAIEDRVRLIQGFFDATGYFNKYEECATNSVIEEQLSSDIIEILGSLGYVSHLSTKKTYITDKGYIYEIKINYKENNNIARLCLLSNNKAELSDYDRDNKVRTDNVIVKINKLIYTEEMTCFLVDNDEHLFLTENFIVTHNTRILIERIRSLVQDKNIDPKEIVAITFTNMAASEMKKRLNALNDSRFDQMYIGTVHGYANSICLDNGINTQQYIDKEEYDKLLELAVKVPKKKLPHTKHVLIDECQDLSPLEFKFFNYLNTDNIFFVGDNRQCQPCGTKVKLRNGEEKNIEDVEVGDSLVWYSNEDRYIGTSTQSIEKKVNKIAVRDFSNDNLITIDTDLHKTRYTPNHICYARFCENKTNIVYLECNDKGLYSIGVIELKYLQNRLRDILNKDNSKFWILRNFDSRLEANEFQMNMLSKYLPFYNDAAARCLKESDKDIRYPLISSDCQDKSILTPSCPFEIFASNLMPNIMEVISFENGIQQFEVIKNITYTFIENPIKVYSLEVEGGTYIADNIVTHNCIYQFRGSSDEYLLKMHKDGEFKKYYLTENYRNAPNIIHFADDFLASMQQVSPASQAMKSRNGIIERCSFEDAIDELQYDGKWGSWFVLTRTNKELEKAMEILEDRGIPCVTFKKSDLNLTQLELILASNKVKLLTIHMSKGLENKNVIVIGAKVFNEEERKISYVAATRAEQNLYWCPTIVPRGRAVQKKKNFASNLDIIEF